MKDFKGELSLLCLQKGVSLEELQEVVLSMVEAPICKRGMDVIKYICTLDGYDYFLGDYFKEDVSWYEAIRYAESLGSGWEVPSREVLEQMFLKRETLGISSKVWLWSGEEYSATYAWSQCFDDGYQNYYLNKTFTTDRSVRPVKKVKV